MELGYTGNRRVLSTPSGAGVGQRRILIIISIRFFPHRTTNSIFTIIANLRWRCCPGDRATRAVFTRASRDREAAVSFFRTRQAEGKVHLRAALRQDCRILRHKSESIVNAGALS